MARGRMNLGRRKFLTVSSVAFVSPLIMKTFSIGNKVRIKNRPDWPSPPGYIFANAEGTVVASDFDEVMGEFQPHLVFVKLEKVGEAAQK